MRTIASLLLLLLIVPGASAPQAVPERFYLGFDRNYYPGDDAMKELRKEFVFTSYWLSNPPQTKKNAWSGKREFLHSLGFGFLPLFSGREDKELRNEAQAQNLGRDDARATAAAADREGFLKGSLIFLDIEDGGRLSPAYRAYVQGWLLEITSLGYRGGFYCSAIPVDEGKGKSVTTAEDIREFLGKNSRPFALWVFNDACPPSPGCDSRQAPLSPAKSGIADAQVWQFVRSPWDKESAGHCRGYAKDNQCYAALDAAHRYNLDLNSATSADPSAPR